MRTISAILTFLLCAFFSGFSQSVTIIQPNGGESIFQCTTYAVQWSQTGTPSNYWTIDYTLDNGTNWISIVNNYYSTNGTYNWTIPAIANSSARIRVYDSQFAFTFDESDTEFTFDSAITITAPIGGDEHVLIQGEQNLIAWTAAGGGTGPYKVERTNSTIWSTISASTPNTSVNWTTPVFGDNFRIRVTDLSNTCRVAETQTPISIFQVRPKLNYPNGGESILIASNFTVSWQANSMLNGVRIFLSKDGGLTWTSVVNFVSNASNTYTAQITGEGSDNCLIKIVDATDPSRYDVSDSAFTLLAPVQIGTWDVEEVVSCTVLPIHFTRTSAFSNYRIVYRAAGAISWQTIETSWAAPNTTDVTYNWTVPNLDGTFEVGVYPVNNIDYLSYSEAILIRPALRLLTPDNGVWFLPGEVQTIEWENTSASGVYDISYSVNSGNTFTPIVTGYLSFDNQYDWTIPNETSVRTTVIKVQDSNSACKTDRSGAQHSITGNVPIAEITFPTLYTDTLYACEVNTITWQYASGFVYRYDVFYATEFDISNLIIAQNLDETVFSANWLVPETLVGKRVRIMLKVNDSAPNNEYSDAYIYIAPSRIRVASSSVNVCAGTTVQLSATGPGSIQWESSESLSDALSLNPTSTPAQTTTYFANSEYNGCILRDSVTVHVVDPAQPFALEVIHPTSSSICRGEPFIVRALASNGGADIGYSWYINDVLSGTNSAELTIENPTTGMSVYCVATRMNTCGGAATAVSNTIQLSVATPWLSSVTVAMNQSLIQCEGSGVVFQATTLPEMPDANYHWLINGEDQNVNSATFTPALNEGNLEVLLLVSTDNGCAISRTISSLPINIRVKPLPDALGGLLNSTYPCLGENAVINILPANNATYYDWQLPEGWPGESQTLQLTTVFEVPGLQTVYVTPMNGCGAGPTWSYDFNVLGFEFGEVELVGLDSICEGALAEFTFIGGNEDTYYVWSISSNTWDLWNDFGESVDVLAGTGTATLQVSAYNTCATTSVLTRTLTGLDPLPPLSAISGSASICPGDTMVYQVDPFPGAISYNWEIPNAWSGSSTSNTISIVAQAAPANIWVSAVTDCGTTQKEVLTVYEGSPNQSLGPMDGPIQLCAGQPVDYTFVENVNWVNDFVWTVPNGWQIVENENGATVTPASNSGVLQVYGTNGCGNSIPIELTLQVYNTPTVNVVTTPSNVICYGQPLTLTANGSFSNVSWTNNVQNGVPFVPNQGNTYTVTAMNGVCSAQQSVTVTVLPIPNVTLDLSFLGQQCNNINIIGISAGEPEGGVYAGTAVSGSTFSPSTAGVGNWVVSYTYTASNGCSATDTDVITVYNCASVDEDYFSSMKVFPNPGSGEFILSLPTQVLEINIYNAQGGLVKKQNSHPGDNFFDLTGHASGVYFISIPGMGSVKYIKE